jgi:CheY-like chemotaxis protein
VSSTAELRGRFLTGFCDIARARLGRCLDLLAAGASTNAAAIQVELYALAGEAAFLEYSDLVALAREGEAAARRMPEDPAAVVGCTRAIRALGRALDGLGPQRPRGSSPSFPAPAPPEADARGRILVVDDSKLNTDLLKAMLSEEGFEVETASNAPGLERALTTFRLDLALADVNMPGLDCALVCRRVREAAPRARIVLISGLEEEALARECRRASADGYVPRARGPAAVLERVIAEMAGRTG